MLQARVIHLSGWISGDEIVTPWKILVHALQTKKEYFKTNMAWTIELHQLIQ